MRRHQVLRICGGERWHLAWRDLLSLILAKKTLQRRGSRHTRGGEWPGEGHGHLRCKLRRKKVSQRRVVCGTTGAHGRR